MACGLKLSNLFRLENSCDYIKHPRLNRFRRAMKQIFKPSKILSHFVHYSIVSSNLAQYHRSYSDTDEYDKVGSGGSWDSNERFLDELTEGVLVHAKSVLPHETMTRTASCQNASKHICSVGHVCPDSVEFDDENHQWNVFHDSNGKYCNCWVDSYVEHYWVPLLESELWNFRNINDDHATKV
jgi:hypothetical protein